VSNLPVNHPSLGPMKKRKITPSYCSSLVVLVIISAKKKCLNLTNPNGAINICSIVFIIYILASLSRISYGLKNENAKVIIMIQVKTACESAL